MCDCLNCSDITVPQGIQGPTGPQGPAGTNGTNGTNGLNGAALINTIFTRPSTSATGGYTEITNIPLDITKVFSATGDAVEFEILFSYEYVSGTVGGNAKLTIEDGTNVLTLFSAGLGGGIQAVQAKGTIVRASNSSINLNFDISQPASALYSSPSSTIGPVYERGTIYTITNPGTIDNTSSSLKLSAKGLLGAGTNNIKVEFFKAVSLKKIT